MTLGRATARVAGAVAVVLASFGGLAGGLAAQAPTVTGLAVDAPNTVSKVASAQNYYFAGERIIVRVTFSDSVNVTGTPRVVLGIGSCTDCYAEYTSGNGDVTLVFEYHVLIDDSDSDGISIAANALELNGGTIVAKRRSRSRTTGTAE